MEKWNIFCLSYSSGLNSWYAGRYARSIAHSTRRLIKLNSSRSLRPSAAQQRSSKSKSSLTSFRFIVFDRLSYNLCGEYMRNLCMSMREWRKIIIKKTCFACCQRPCVIIFFSFQKVQYLFDCTIRFSWFFSPHSFISYAKNERFQCERVSLKV